MSNDQEAKKIPSERWWRIIPVLIIVYMIAYIDRINISFAIAGGMSEDLGMTASLSGLAAGIFFIGYMILPVPGGHIAEKGNAKPFIAFSILGWGVFTILSAFAQNSTQFLILRFLLGVSEGGVWPAIFSIISHWFPSKEVGRASTFFVSTTSFGAIVAGPMSGIILSYYDWRMLFIAQGVLSLVLLFLWYPLVSNRPAEAKWISREEREYLETTIAAEQKILNEKNAGGATSYKYLLKDINMWKLIVIYFAYQTGNYGYIIWLPSIVKEMTKTGMSMVGFLNTLPFIAALLGLYVFGTLSDKNFNRRKYVVTGLMGCGTLLILSVLLKTNIWLSFSLMVFCCFFLKPSGSLFWTMPPLLFFPEVLGGVRGIINAVGNLGGLVGPWVVGGIVAYTGNYNTGIFVMGTILILGALLTATMPKITAEALKK